MVCYSSVSSSLLLSILNFHKQSFRFIFPNLGPTPAYLQGSKFLVTFHLAPIPEPVQHRRLSVAMPSIAYLLGLIGRCNPLYPSKCRYNREALSRWRQLSTAGIPQLLLIVYSWCSWSDMLSSCLCSNKRCTLWPITNMKPRSLWHFHSFISFYSAGYPSQIQISCLNVCLP